MKPLGDEVFNPLDKTHLAESVIDRLLKRPIIQLPPKRFRGAGIHAIYTGADSLHTSASPISQATVRQSRSTSGKLSPRDREKAATDSESILGTFYSSGWVTMLPQFKPHAILIWWTSGVATF